MLCDLKKNIEFLETNHNNLLHSMKDISRNPLYEKYASLDKQFK